MCGVARVLGPVWLVILVFSGVLVASSVLASSAYAQPTAEPGAVPPGIDPDDALMPTWRDPEEQQRNVLWGYFSTRFRARVTGPDDDFDVYGMLNLEMGDEEKDQFSGSGLLRVTGDIDGVNPSATTFADPNDASGDTARFQLYYAYLNIKDAGLDNFDIRVGRQELESRLGPTFDGVRLAYALQKEWLFSIFGGWTAYLYQTTQVGDVVVGGSVVWFPKSLVKGLRLSLEGLYLQDENPTLGFRENVRFELRGFYAVDVFSTNIRLRMLDDKFQELNLNAFGVIDEIGLEIRGSYSWLVEPYRDFTTEFAQFYAVTTDFEPYHDFRVAAIKYFDWPPEDEDDPLYSVEIGFALRELEDDSKVGLYNHEFIRLYGGFSASNPFEWVGWSASLDVSFYRAEGENTLFGVSLGFTYEEEDVLRLGFGTAFDLYYYDRITMDERAQVQTFYVEARWFIEKWIYVQGRYELQFIFDEDELHVFTLTARIDF